MVNLVNVFLSKTSLGVERSVHKFRDVRFEAARVRIFYSKVVVVYEEYNLQFGFNVCVVCSAIMSFSLSRVVQKSLGVHV